MGVHGLWQLLKPTGKPVTLESLEGKVLAVDISIWLHQAVRGMRDSEGNLVNNAHLVTLLHRICKLLYFRIKPIFVFDGSVPELKRRTMAARRKRKEIGLEKSGQASEQILRNYMKVHAVDTVLGKKKSVKKPKIPRGNSKADAAPNMYILPPLPTATEGSPREEENEDDIWDEHQRHRSWLADHYQKIDDIDIHSKDFNELTPEIQYELIEEYLERNKHNSWAKKNVLPKEANEFSDFQLSKLLNKNKLNQRLVNIRDEMSKRSSGEIASFLDGETKSIEARRVVSEDTQHYILVKTQKLKKRFEEAKDELKPSGSKDIMKVEEFGSSSKSLWNIDTVDLTKEEESKTPITSLWNIDTVDLTKEEESKTPITAKDLDMAIQAIFNNQKAKMLKKDLSNTSNNKTDSTSTDSISNKSDLDQHKSNINRVITDKDLNDVSKFQNNSSRLDNVDVDLTEEVPAQEKVDVQIDDGRDFTFSKSSICTESFIDTEKNKNIEMGTEATSYSHTVDVGDPTQKVNDQIDDRRDISFSKSAICTGSVIDLTDEIPGQENDDHVELVRDIEVIPNSTVHTRSFIDGERTGKEVENQTAALEENRIESKQTPDDGAINHKPRQKDELKDEIRRESSNKSDEESKFIEVSFDPAQARGNDDMFPAEIFMQTNPDVHNHITTNEDDAPEYTTTNVSQLNRKQITELQRKEEEMMVAISKDREKSLKEWKDMNTNDVKEMENALEQERATLQSEHQRQQRIGASITDQMYAESKELLELFGIPYIVSPQEAEAQCAFLDLHDQTHGSITDDSDVWLFGGRKVYRNFFNKDKDVEFYESSNFESQLFLDRMKLVNMALLLGCDYTDGVDGVGGITAMEILSEFPGGHIDGLKDFRAWWDANAGNLNPPVETKIKSQLRKLNLPSTFPQEEVVKAFMSPLVDESADEFTWGLPDLDSIREFALERLSWNTKKTNENVLPVLKRMNETNIQRSITSFFGHAAGQQKAIQSKRLKRVLKKFQHNPSDSDEEKTSSKSQGGKQTNKKGPGRKRKAANDVNEEVLTKKNVRTKNTTKDTQSKQRMELSDNRISKRRTKVVKYSDESDSDKMDEQSKQKNSAKHVEWKGPNLSESGSSSEND